MLCGNINAKEIQRGGDICTHIAESLHCAAEIDTAV